MLTNGEGLLARASALRTGSSIGSAIAGLATPIIARGVQKEVAKTRELVSSINARRAARDARYALGLARTQVAASGGSANQGSYRYVVADDVRKAEERVQDIYLQARLQTRRDEAATPTLGNAVLNLAGAVSSGIGENLNLRAQLSRG